MSFTFFFFILNSPLLFFSSYLFFLLLLFYFFLKFSLFLFLSFSLFLFLLPLLPLLFPVALLPGFRILFFVRHHFLFPQHASFFLFLFPPLLVDPFSLSFLLFLLSNFLFQLLFLLLYFKALLKFPAVAIYFRIFVFELFVLHPRRSGVFRRSEITI